MERYDSLGHEIIYNHECLAVGAWWQEGSNIRVQEWVEGFSDYMMSFGSYMADKLIIEEFLVRTAIPGTLQ